MRLTTKYWIGLRHVGDSTSEPIIEEMTMQEAVQRLGRFLLANTLTRRIEWIMARSEDEIRSRFDAKHQQNQADAFDDLESMLADIEAESEAT